MKKMKCLFNLLLIVIICNPLFAQIDIEKSIPTTWEVHKILQIPSSKLPLFSSKLKGEIGKINNYFINTEDGEIQVNKIICKNSLEADKVYKSMVALHKSEITCFKRNVEVFEFRSNKIELIKKVKKILNTAKGKNNLKINLSSVFVEDQNKALKFYTETLGFVKKEDIPLGEFRWLTVVSADGPGYLELVLEPNILEAARTYQSKLFKQGIPLNSFEVDDLQSEYERLKKLGVQFTIEPTKSVGSIMAIFNDTCGNLIQIYQVL